MEWGDCAYAMQRSGELHQDNWNLLVEDSKSGCMWQNASIQEM